MKRSLLALFFAVTALVTTGIRADEAAGTKDEAKALVEAAVAHIKQVGPDKAYQDFAADKTTWTKKDLYVFVMDANGDMKFHGANDKLANKNHMNIKDQNGKAFNQEMLAAAAANGETWEEYYWMNPVTKKVAPKSTYFKRIPGMTLGVGCGVYH